MFHGSIRFPEALLGLITFSLAFAASVHAVLRRRNPHAALYWLLVAWVFPLVGPFLYYFFGINRVQRRAARLRRRRNPRAPSPYLILSSSIEETSISYEMRHLLSLCRVVENAVKLPLTRGNDITPLINGEEAFPAMLTAIDRAEKSVALSTYIFDGDEMGRRFIDALARAVDRGVQVRVLIDDVGAGLHWRSVYRELAERRVPVAYFLPTLAPWRMSYINLRNHRKILVVDGQIAFSGGMNITAHHLVRQPTRHTAQDVHFRIHGPVVAQVMEAFRVDWHFTTGELLNGALWFPELQEHGITFARGIADGPDENFENGKFTLLGALAHARRTIRIVTPYLIPDVALVSALNLAVMSGVQVDVVLPEKSDLSVVSWATQAMLWQLLERGVRVWRSPFPFDHSKLMVIDGGWTLFGSTNWDSRSLRLNFEFNVECYGRGLAARIEDVIDTKIAVSHRVTLAEMDSRALPIKLRDGIARLFSPLL